MFTIVFIGLYWMRFGVTDVFITDYFQNFDFGFHVVRPLWAQLVAKMIKLSPLIFTLSTAPIFVTNSIENFKLIFTNEVDRTPIVILFMWKFIFLSLVGILCLFLSDIEWYLIISGPALAVSCNIIPNMMHLRAINKAPIQTGHDFLLSGKGFGIFFIILQSLLVVTITGVSVYQKVSNHHNLL